MAAPIIETEIDNAQVLEELEIDLLLEGIFQYFRLDFRGYKRAPLRRKLHGFMQAGGLKTVSALQDRIMHDQDASNALLRALSAHPVALFDDPEYFHALRDVLETSLRSWPSLKVWIAECSSTAEACTLAILLMEAQLYDKTQIFATGANEALLQEASEGTFPLDRLHEYEENYRRSGGKYSLSDYYCESNGQAVFLPQVRSNITWAEYSLATDASFNEFQLIICRKTLADFRPFLRHRSLQLFYESLSLFGILSVDGADDLQAAPFATRYKTISKKQGLYRRIV